MNICICISGLVRTLDECYGTMVSHLINPNPNHNFDLIGILDTKDNNKIDLSKYNFKKYIISTDDELPNLDYQLEKLHIDLSTFPNNYYQLEGMKKVNKLRLEIEKENNIEYDLIIRTRTDFKFYTSVFLDGIDFNNEIFLPYGNDHRGGYNDRFAIGNRNLMDQYMNRFDFWVNKQDHIKDYSTHAEVNLKQFLEEKKININRISFGYCLRRNGYDLNEYNI